MESLSATAHSWFNRLAGERHSLRRTAIVGSQYLLGRSILTSGLELVKTVIFSRVLFPEDYGLIALAMMPISLFEAFSAIGVEIMIQKDNGSYERRMPAYWTVRLLRGCILFGACWIVAGPVADYYSRPDLVVLVRFMAVSFLFAGLSGFGREVRQRNMNYERIAAADSLAAASSLVVGLPVLFCTPNAWALASYHVLSSFFALVSSYALYPWKPSLCWNKDLFRATTAFASSLLLISILNYFFNNLDKAFIGKWFGIEELGYYTRGYYLALIPAAHLTQAVSPVAFNALRKVADEPVRMREAFLKISAVTACAAILIGFGFLAFSRTAIILAYGERWLPALPVLRVMIVFGMVKSIGPVCSAIFFLKEKPGMIAIATAAMMAAFLSVCVPLTIEFGTVGTAAAVAIAGLFSHALSFVLAFRLVRADARQASA